MIKEKIIQEIFNILKKNEIKKEFNIISNEFINILFKNLYIYIYILVILLVMILLMNTAVFCLIFKKLV